MMRLSTLLPYVLAALVVVGCGKDDNQQIGTSNNVNVEDMATAEDTGGGDTGGGDDVAVADMGSGDDMAATDMAADMAPADGDFLALIIGTLASADLAEAKMSHDAVAAAGEDSAKGAGDFAHKVMLGTTMLGTTENEFLGIDRWTSLEGAMAVYSDPTFQAAFGSIFAAPPPVPQMFVHQTGWHEWGDFNIADAGDHVFIVVRGRLAEADPATAQASHDAIAAGGEMAATGAGDLAHLVFTGAADPQEFLAIDIWSDTTNLEAFYTDPGFVAAFGTLFEAPPTIGVYQSSDWHQW